MENDSPLLNGAPAVSLPLNEKISQQGPNSLAV